MVDELLYVVPLILLAVRFCRIRVRIKCRPIVILWTALGASRLLDASNLTHNLIYGKEEVSFVVLRRMRGEDRRVRDCFSARGKLYFSRFSHYARRNWFWRRRGCSDSIKRNSRFRQNRTIIITSDKKRKRKRKKFPSIEKLGRNRGETAWPWAAGTCNFTSPFVTLSRARLILNVFTLISRLVNKRKRSDTKFPTTSRIGKIGDSGHDNLQAWYCSYAALIQQLHPDSDVIPLRFAATITIIITNSTRMM